MITVIYGPNVVEIDAAGMTTEIYEQCRHVLNLPPLNEDLECVVAPDDGELQ